MMYAIIWVAFIQILIVLFPVIGTFPTYDLHLVVGAIVMVLAYLIFTRVRVTSCPDRIKRITKATFGFAVFEAFLGVALYGAVSVNAGGVLVVGLLLTGLSIIPLVYGLSVTVNPAAYGVCQSCGRGWVGTVATYYYILGGVLLAVGLALSGCGIAQKDNKPN